MHPCPPSKKLFFALLYLFAFSAFFSCQKDFSNDTVNTGGISSDLGTKTAASVSGFVTDENNAPVANAAVQFGSSSTSTNKYGYFEVHNAQVPKNAAFVSITKTGYFKGFKTFIADKTANAFFRIKLIPKVNSGNLSGASGGSISLPGGLSISFPAGAVVTASGNTAYTGTVNVAAYHINPDAADLAQIMPGDLRGVNTGGAVKLLKTYGMVAVELTGASGEGLQLASGKKATITMPIPAALQAAAPASIPLWYFDETNGLWKEEGTATKNGNNYTGEVAHFSYWNCDFPFPDAVQFDCNVVGPNGQPVAGIEVWIYYSDGQFTGCHGTTDSAGHAAGAVPANSQLVVKIFDYRCFGNPLASESFTTGTSNVSLGNISIPAVNVATLTGNLVDCNNQPVNNGILYIYSGTYLTTYHLTGPSFTINNAFCSGTTISLIPVNPSAGQEGNQQTYTLTPGTNNLGTLSACGNASNEFFNFSINNTPFAISQIPGVGTVYHTPDSLGQGWMEVSGYQLSGGYYCNISFSSPGIGPGSSQNVAKFVSHVTGATTIPSPFAVNITEYGPVGQFISGNFSGAVTGTAAPNTNYNVSGSFRVRRYQ